MVRSTVVIPLPTIQNLTICVVEHLCFAQPNNPHNALQSVYIALRYGQKQGFLLHFEVIPIENPDEHPYVILYDGISMTLQPNDSDNA